MRPLKKGTRGLRLEELLPLRSWLQANVFTAGTEKLPPDSGRKNKSAMSQIPERGSEGATGHTYQRLGSPVG